MGIRVRWRSWILLLLTKSSTSSYPKISHLLTVFFAVCCQSCFFWFECLFVAEKGGIDFDAFVIGSNASYFPKQSCWRWPFLDWGWKRQGGCQPEIEKIEPQMTPGRLLCFYSDYTTHLWINNRFSIIYKSYKLIRVTRGCLPTISMIWMSCCHCFGAIRQCQCLGRSAGQQWI